MKFMTYRSDSLVRPATALACFAFATSSASASLYFVRASAPGGPGTTWAGAFHSVSSALAVAVPGDEIRVAEGTYLPGITRSSSFIVSGVTLRGGFPAAGGSMATRNPELYPTILSGDIGVAGDVSDNSYHVVVLGGDMLFVGTLDGFVVSGGNANGLSGSELDLGGGVLAQHRANIAKCRISENKAQSGGGIYYKVQSTWWLSVEDCVLIGNDALGSAAAGYGGGGGLFAASDGATGGVQVERSSFLGNTSASLGAGAFIRMQFELTNSVFSGNDAVGPGGALFAEASGIALATVANCTIANNHTYDTPGGGGLWANHVQVVNSILWGNTAGPGSAPVLDQQLLVSLSSVEYCDTQGSVFTPGSENRSVDPRFARALGPDMVAGTTDDNLRLSIFSPCIDVGDNARAALPYDRAGNIRIAAFGTGGISIVDLGAYECVLRSPPVIAFP